MHHRTRLVSTALAALCAGSSLFAQSLPPAARGGPRPAKAFALTLGSPTSYPVSIAPHGVAIGDVSSDGLADAVVACEGIVMGFPSGASVLLGDGAGGFGPPTNHFAYPTDDWGCRAVAIGDLDGNGKRDVALAAWAWNSVVMLHGDGQGGFAQGDFGHMVGDDPSSIAIGDLDADGTPDLVATSEGYDTVAVLLGTGGGGFAPAQSYAVGNQPVAVAIADLNGDGWLDVVCANLGSGSVLLGLGGGALAPAVTFGSGDVKAQLVLSDLNADGALDVATLDSDTNAVTVFDGDGLGGFSAPASYPVGNSPRSLALADLDGDGWPELLTANRASHDFSVLPGQGPAGFGAALTFYGGPNPVFVTTGDLNGDGRPDVVVTNDPGNTISVVMNLLPPPPPCTTQTTYCVATTNSAGCLPRICSSGSPTLSGPDDFTVEAVSVLSHQNGLFFWGFGPASLPLGKGLVCVAPAFRSAVQDSGGTPGQNDCSGTYQFAFDQAYMATHGLAAGVDVFGQFWSRDTYLPQPFAMGFSDALRITILP